MRSMSAPRSDPLMDEPRIRPDTPCVAVCSTTFDEVCRGCGRTVVEVAHWVSMSELQKELVWQRILAQGYPRRNK
jgi:predicted Fe-S protein YdhL (DUF1289 family)